MKLKLVFEDGTTKYVRIPSTPVKISIHKTKFRPLFPRPDQPELWNGLWITDTNLFVEVVTSEEAYTLNSKGGRMIRCQITVDGTLYIDRSLACKLIERRRGAETTIQGIEWPTLLGA